MVKREPESELSGDPDRREDVVSPVYVSLSQPISGYNSFRWEKKIEPRKYELAKREYLESMEAITVTVAGYFFDLLLAQQRFPAGFTRACAPPSRTIRPRSDCPAPRNLPP